MQELEAGLNGSLRTRTEQVAKVKEPALLQ